MLKKLFFLAVFSLGFSLPSQAAKLPDSLKAEAQYRDAATYSWDDRHQAVLLRNKTVKPDYVLMGDSITHKWGGEPKDSMGQVGTDSWKELFRSYKVTNMGYGYDFIDNAYYRVKQGELDGISPRVITLLLGTNNIGHRKDSAAVCGANMKALVELIRKKCPKSKILLLGVLPRLDCEFSIPVIKETNKLYEKLADSKNIFFANPGSVLLEPNTDKPKREYMADGVHLSAEGYKVVGKELEKTLPIIDPLYTPPNQVDLVYIGDSITDNYHKSSPPHEDFAPIWNEFYAPFNAKNLGISGNTTEDVLNRIDKGILDNISPRVAVIMIGTNDTGRTKTEEETLNGIQKVVSTGQTRLPQSHILLLGILPSNIYNWHVAGAKDPDKKAKTDKQINKKLVGVYAKNPKVTFLDIGKVFLLPDGTVNAALFYDPDVVVINGKKAGPLHPNTKGQRLMAEAIKPTLDKIFLNSKKK